MRVERAPDSYSGVAMYDFESLTGTRIQATRPTIEHFYKMYHEPEFSEGESGELGRIHYAEVLRLVSELEGSE